LETIQRGSVDITEWLTWFLQTLELTLKMALNRIEKSLNKTMFWQNFNEIPLLPVQVKMLNCLLDDGEHGFEHGELVLRNIRKLLE
jgi:Fic family protein